MAERPNALTLLLLRQYSTVGRNSTLSSRRSSCSRPRMASPENELWPSWNTVDVMMSRPVSPPAARAGGAEQSASAARAANEQAVSRRTDDPPWSGGSAATVGARRGRRKGVASLAAHAIVDEAALEPRHADQVVDPSPQPVPHAVLADPPRPRPVPHRHLHEARASERAQRGQEPVDAHEHGQALQHLAPI